MGFRERLNASFNAFIGKVPAGKAQQEPYFFHYNVSGTPAQNLRVNHTMLRQMSEVPVVRRGIDYIRNQIGRLDWAIVPKAGVKVTVADRKKADVMKSVLLTPNPDDNWQSWIGAIVEDMLVIGMGTSEVKQWDNPDQPFLLYPVDSASIQIYMDWDGNPNKPRYAQVDIRNQYIDFKPRELMVMKHNSRTNTPFGLSPVEVAVNHIQYLLDVQAYAGKTASNAYPKKLLFLGSELSEPQLQAFRMYFKNEVEGRSHLPIVGGVEDVKSIELGLASDNSLFLSWQQHLIAIVAMCFNMDIQKFNVIAGINRSTGDVIDDNTDESCIQPMAHQIEHYLNSHLLSLAGLSDKFEFKFRFTSSFQDRKALASLHQIYGNLEVMTINEIREELGKDPLPYDEMLGKSKGDLTISEFRAVFGGQVSLADAVGVDEDTNTTNPQSVDGQKKVADAKGTNGSNKSKNGTQDPNGDGGQNGVHGTPAPKDKPMNQRNDKNST